jgi:hypothetical protein
MRIPSRSVYNHLLLKLSKLTCSAALGKITRWSDADSQMKDVTNAKKSFCHHFMAPTILLSSDVSHLS